MRLRPVLFAIVIAAATACWLAIPAQQQSPAVADRVPVDASEVPTIAARISQRSEHLSPMLEQVHPAEWVAKGAPEAYASQWKSLAEQNQAIKNDMTAIAEHPEGMQDAMRALFRVHRFDSDLNALLVGVRRYQNPALADLIESVATGDQSGVEKLQQYVLDLADASEQQLRIENDEAQRCRSTLANQPPVRTPSTPSAARKSNGTSK
jgi:hypothetical protein